MASSVADQWHNTNVDELEGNQKKAQKWGLHKVYDHDTL